MTFQPNKIDDFKQIFDRSKDKILDFDGCQHLELLQAENRPSVFFTYSIWKSEAHLEQYRHSELFQRTWGATKQLFKAPPRAWTTQQHFRGSK
jgi:quinol monooxygenase YgiN